MSELAEAVQLWGRIDWSEDDRRTDEMRLAYEIVFAAARRQLALEPDECGTCINKAVPGFVDLLSAVERILTPALDQEA